MEGQLLLKCLGLKVGWKWIPKLFDFLKLNYMKGSSWSKLNLTFIPHFMINNSMKSSIIQPLWLKYHEAFDLVFLFS